MVLFIPVGRALGVRATKMVEKQFPFPKGVDSASAMFAVIDNVAPLLIDLLFVENDYYTAQIL